ncbi:hypothetical protein ADICEAN_02366 [Cesiribacter andamanensis AMV16]|uniref:Uncharacterized protein n=2 Tax=Cesiribacter TaxID=1133570 RepID=M7N1D5_9BACT|nr:hypothetical protein ADICEAN_02366 [Cesiribacter andamanensis AMV16]
MLLHTGGNLIAGFFMFWGLFSLGVLLVMLIVLKMRGRYKTRQLPVYILFSLLLGALSFGLSIWVFMYGG